MATGLLLVAFSCVGVSTGRGGQMEGREGERTGERLKRGKGVAQRKEKRVKGVERRAFGRVLELFLARVGVLTGCSCMMLRGGRLNGA